MTSPNQDDDRCSSDRETTYLCEENNEADKCIRKAVVRIDGKNYCFEHGEMAWNKFLEGLDIV